MSVEKCEKCENFWKGQFGQICMRCGHLLEPSEFQQAAEAVRKKFQETFPAVAEMAKEYNEKLGIPSPKKITTRAPDAVVSTDPHPSSGTHPLAQRVYERTYRITNRPSGRFPSGNDRLKQPLGVDYAELERRVVAGAETQNEKMKEYEKALAEAKTPEQRRAIKNLYLHHIYGTGPKKIAEMLEAPQRPLRPLGTITGRLSSREPTAQEIPKDPTEAPLGKAEFCTLGTETNPCWEIPMPWETEVPKYLTNGPKALAVSRSMAEEKMAIDSGKWLDVDEMLAAVDAGLAWMTRPFKHNAGAFGHPALLKAIDEYDDINIDPSTGKLREQRHMPLAEFLRRHRLNEQKAKLQKGNYR